MDEVLITRFQDHMNALELPDYLIDYWMNRLYNNTLTESQVKTLLCSDVEDFQHDYDYSINY